jgi:hypothetical protein
VETKRNLNESMPDSFEEITYIGAPLWAVLAWRTLLFTVGFSTTAIFISEIQYHNEQVRKFGAQSKDVYIQNISKHNITSIVLMIGAIASMWSLIALLYGRVQGKHMNLRRVTKGWVDA